MIFAWYFQDGRKSFCVGVDSISYLFGNLGTVLATTTPCTEYSQIITHMLVDKQYGDVFSLLREVIKSLLYSRVLCLGIDN